MADYTFHAFPTRPRKKRRRDKISREFIYTRQDLERKLWDIFSLYIRLRDGMQCVMRGIPGHTCWGTLQAGHVIPRGKKPVKYEERNVYAQCEGGNRAHNEDPTVFKGWFIRVHGVALYKELKRKGELPWHDYSVQELRRKISYYQHKIAELRSVPIVVPEEVAW